jgi:hypothetical protein
MELEGGGDVEGPYASVDRGGRAGDDRSRLWPDAVGGGRPAFPTSDDQAPVTEPVGTEPVGTEPADGEPAVSDSRGTEPVDTEGAATDGRVETDPSTVVSEITVPEAASRAGTGDTSFVEAPCGTAAEALPEPVCPPTSLTPTSTDAVDLLDQFFDLGRPMVGADYQRAYPLPDGRVLWLFQDAFLPTPTGTTLVHNAGLLQSGDGFQLLRSGSAESPRSFLFADVTVPWRHWYWPLGGDLGLDGELHVFVAEMVEHGSSYLTSVEPMATWLVTIDSDDLTVVDQRLAPDPSASLYGWSVVSAGDHTYLYAHCYRQFGWDPIWFAPETLGHDLDCCGDVTLARVPRGDFDATPEYWDGDGWSDDPEHAVAVIPVDGRDVNPTQVAVVDGRFVAVTKVGDWWGREIVLDAAPAPEGPWTTYDRVRIEPECDRCNTYFASVVPFGADGSSFVVGLSCNVWGPVELDHYAHYRPMFVRVPLPD